MNKLLIDKLDQFESPDSTYLGWDPSVVLDTAEGSIIKDTEGRSYIDFCSGFGVLSLGHNSSIFRSVLHDYSSSFAPIIHGMGDVYPSASKIRFIETLINALPQHIEKCSLALSGSQAIEIAMKTCLLNKPAGGFIVFENAYHGVDLGALPLSFRDDFRDPFKEWLSGVESKILRLPLHCSNDVFRDAVSKLPNGLAGVFVEPIQGRAGFHRTRTDWLQELLSQTHEAGGLLVLDEIFTGLGRAGQFTRSEDVAADMICLGKAIGGGLPLSVCCGTEEAFSAWPKSQGEAIHTGTFFGHPMACDLGDRVIKEILKLNLCQRSKELGSVALDFIMQSKIMSHESVREVRGHGLMIAIEFVKDGYGVGVMNKLVKNGVISLVSGEKGRCISITPSLTIDEKTLLKGLKIIESSIVS